MKTGADAHSALDGTPDLGGTNVYFTAIDPTAGEKLVQEALALNPQLAGQ